MPGFLFSTALSQLYDAIETLKNLPGQQIDELIHFFNAYNEMSGKQFEPLEKPGRKEALQLITECRIPEE